ncbi:MAG: hypothetical protein SFX72_08490 [Isosphaeraceae bacterium]|nr:hypothetical protein [Isosphaeraceae bacterium]
MIHRAGGASPLAPATNRDAAPDSIAPTGLSKGLDDRSPRNHPMWEFTGGDEISVQMTRSIYRRLLQDAFELQVPVEWLVASIVADAVDDESTESPDSVAA